MGLDAITAKVQSLRDSFGAVFSAGLAGSGIDFTNISEGITD
jgi:hypothetical protein